MSNLNILINLSSSIFEIPVSDIDIESSQDNIKGWDSLATIKLITELEKEFSIQFDIMEIVELTSIGKVVDILKNKGIDFNDS
jgi:acyl carrier protein